MRGAVERTGTAYVTSRGTWLALHVLMVDAMRFATRRRPLAKASGPSSWSVWKDLSGGDLVRVPGLLSLARIPLAAAFPLTLGHPGWGLTVLLVAGATDLLDGWYARRFHQETPTGAALDGFTDKVFVITVAGSLAAFGAMSLFEMLLLGTRELGELALAVRLAADPRRRQRVKVHSANRAGKIATMFQFAAIVTILLGFGPRTALVGATALAGIIASASYWNREVEALRPASCTRA